MTDSTILELQAHIITCLSAKLCYFSKYIVVQSILSYYNHYIPDEDS